MRLGFARRGDDDRSFATVRLKRVGAQRRAVQFATFTEDAGHRAFAANAIPSFLVRHARTLSRVALLGRDEMLRSRFEGRSPEGAPADGTERREPARVERTPSRPP